MTSTNAFVPQFWNDFAAAEPCSGDIKDTYRWAFDLWKHNYIFLTALAVVLRHKAEYWTDNRNYELAKLYGDLFEETAGWAEQTLHGDALDYYWREMA